MTLQVNEEPLNELYLNLGSVARDRSHIYRLLIDAIHYPTYELAEKLVNGSFYTEAKDHVNWVNAGSGIFTKPLEKLNETVESIKDLQPEELLKKMENEYTRLFLEDERAVVPLYEVSYSGCKVDVFTAQQELENIYQLEGIHNHYDSYKKADFIGTELEYVYYLCFKEAEAWGNGKMGIAKQLKRKQREFLTNHVGIWGGILFKQVVISTELPVYNAIGMLGCSFIKLERGN